MLMCLRIGLCSIRTTGFGSRMSWMSASCHHPHVGNRIQWPFHPHVRIGPLQVQHMVCTSLAQPTCLDLTSHPICGLLTGLHKSWDWRVQDFGCNAPNCCQSQFTWKLDWPLAWPSLKQCGVPGFQSDWWDRFFRLLKQYAEDSTFVLPQNFSICWLATACTLNFVLPFRPIPSWGKLCDAIRGHGQDDHQTDHGLEVCELGLLTWVGRRLDRGRGTTLTWGHKASISHGPPDLPSQRLTQKITKFENRVVCQVSGFCATRWCCCSGVFIFWTTCCICQESLQRTRCSWQRRHAWRCRFWRQAPLHAPGRDSTLSMVWRGSYPFLEPCGVDLCRVWIYKTSYAFWPPAKSFGLAIWRYRIRSCSLDACFYCAQKAAGQALPRPLSRSFWCSVYYKLL